MIAKIFLERYQHIEKEKNDISCGLPSVERFSHTHTQTNLNILTSNWHRRFKQLNIESTIFLKSTSSNDEGIRKGNENEHNRMC